jgi:DNA-binding transcriptional regulator YiaG
MGKTKKKTGSRIGEEMIRDMKDLVATLKAGGMAAVEKKFRVTYPHQYLSPPAFDAAAVKAVRAALGVSQPAFAALLGVAPATVRSWELGQTTPSGIARRFLAQIRRDPDYWRKQFAVPTRA